LPSFKHWQGYQVVRKKKHLMHWIRELTLENKYVHSIYPVCYENVGNSN
jgi:hypothetical protein